MSIATVSDDPSSDPDDPSVPADPSIPADPNVPIAPSVQRRQHAQLRDLQQTAARNQPASERRSDPPPPAPAQVPLDLDAPLLDTHRDAGDSRKYRMGQNISMDYSAAGMYGVKQPDQFGSKNILISKDFADIIMQVAITCPKCNCLFDTSCVGISLAQTIQGKCRNSNCENSNMPMQHKIYRFWQINLNCVYLSLINDGGYRGIQAVAWSNCLGNMSKDSYYNHCKFVFKIMETFYDVNMKKAIDDVKEFYLRNNLCTVDENGIYNISISIDGAYQQRGRESTFCVTVAIDVWTGRPIDYEFSVKCFECKLCDDFNDNGKCEYGLFHGPSGTMEVNNALNLFKRSEELGLRYTTYIADGDCKIYPHITKENIYGPEVIINKEECANHLGKRAYKTILTWGENWTQAKGEEQDKKAQIAREKLGEKLAKQAATAAKKAHKGKGGKGKGKGKGSGTQAYIRMAF